MHSFGFGKADRTAYQAFDACPQVNVFALNFLDAVLADAVLLGIEMPLVSSSAIRVIRRDAKGFEQLFQLQKDFVLTASEHLRQDLARVMINRMP